ncbi:hypothetical protein ACTA71_009649 [Dictyostelium dimigraforme]
MIKSIILLLTFICLAFSKPILQVQFFQFEDGQCEGSQSASSSYDGCQNGIQSVVSTFYSNPGECLIFNGGYAILELAESGDTVSYTVYNDESCTNEKSTETISLGSCQLNCRATDKNPFSISVIDSSSVLIPKMNSFVIAYYEGACNGNWTNDYLSVQVMSTGECMNQQIGAAISLSCNKILNQLTISHFDSLNCSTSPVKYETIQLSGDNCNYAGNVNMGLYCN